jgi:magnesium chelatase subunit D
MESKPTQNFTDPIISGLACLAANPVLQNALILDSPPDSKAAIQRILCRFLESSGYSPLRQVDLPSDASEDELWSNLFPDPIDKDGCMRLRNRALLPPAGDRSEHCLLWISDLARLGLPAKRALTAIGDAPIVHLERQGLSASWRNRYRCIAFCRSRDLCAVSHHLLDRFPVRLRADRQNLALPEQKLLLLREIRQPDRSDDSELPPAAVHLEERLRSSNRRPVRWHASALQEILRLGDEAKGPGHRREIALARLAVATAMIEGADTLLTGHVAAAALRQGLQTPADAGNAPDDTPETLPRQEMGADDQTAAADAARADRPVRSTARAVDRPGRPGKTAEVMVSRKVVQSSGEARVLTGLATRAERKDPYPEDRMQRDQIVAALQAGFSAGRRSKSHEGTISGAMKAAGTQDLAFVATLRAAAAYQAIRGRRPGEPLILMREDLRQHRRLETPRQLMILVADISNSMEDIREEPLNKELDWAYTHRAPVTLILAGEAGHRARVCAAGSRHLAKVRTAVQKPKGTATPLAHGLYLALQQIGKATRHGRGVVYKVHLVVVTDGRANVPLACSRGESLGRTEGLQGFNDALQVAAAIRARRPKVRTILLDPGNPYHPELPIRLAMALGAEHRMMKS